MASQAHNQRVQGQPSSNAAGPSTSTFPSTSVDHFKNVTRNNGVAFKATENVSIQSYIDALTSTIPANDVISASRISNGRIAVYLNSKEAVIKAVQHGLEFGGSFHELTPLVRPTTRLILSNVYPEIPNSVLVENLSPFCKVVSPCRPIPLGLKNKQLSHIMSFRRQVHVLISPNVTPPDHINFTFAGTNYRVFLSTESVRCFNCGEFGHISRNCKKKTKLTKAPNDRIQLTHRPQIALVRNSACLPPPATLPRSLLHPHPPPQRHALCPSHARLQALRPPPPSGSAPSRAANLSAPKSTIDALPT